jgi:hypothetical protein
LSRRKFKESLVQHYGAACPTDPSLLRCLVTSEYVHQDRCVAVQLLPQQLLPVYTCGGIDSADDVRNGFLWIDRIDQAYAANQVCLLYDSLSAKLLFLVLNAALLDVDLGVSNLKFRDVHFKKLDVDRSLIPNLQAIYSQAIFATYLMENGVSQPSALLKSVQFSSKRQTSLDDVDRQQNDKAVVSESSNNMSTNS